MTKENKSNDELFQGLKELVETAFPKKCASCGKVFKSSEEYFLETKRINTSTAGLKQVEEGDGSMIIEAFRNCSCGSTLMEFFHNRRDMSKEGIKRREKFEKVLNILQEKNLDKITARTELIKVLRGEKSEILSKIFPSNVKDK